MVEIPEVIGAYAVDREIGRGGMGVVYHGVDTRLGREVAIKALPLEVGGDPDRLARFEREAKALAALNHPNVAGIYGVEVVEGRRYLVLEYVAGETLEERLERGAMGVEDALRTCIEIARGLEAAHAAGVVHRDLKPANVKLDGGRVKILDFGLAVAPEGGSSLSGSLTASPTVTTPRAMTMEGTLLGTAPYMSPEQARGRRVDRRSDVWSYGAVLYECLTGVRAFGGETVTDLLGAIVHKEVEWGLLPRETPVAVRHVLRRCLTKDRDKRLHDVADARVELEEALVNPGGMGEAGGGRRGPGVLVSILAGAACVVVGGAGAWFGGRALMGGAEHAEPGRLRKFDIVVAEPGEMTNTEPKFSPDGTRVAYVLGTQLTVRDLGSFESRQIEAAEVAISPCWSPDGRWIAFAQDRQLMKVPVDGGRPVHVAPLPERLTRAGGIGWFEDGRIVFTTGSTGLLAVSSQGGDPKELLPVASATDVDFHDVSVLPGNRGVLFTTHLREGNWPIEVFDGMTRRVVVEVPTGNAGNPTYSATGHVLYDRTGVNSGIWAIPFSLETLEATGEPFLVASSCASPSAASNGALALLRGTGGGSFQMVWVDRAGNVEVIGEPEPTVFLPRISPDGKRIGVSGWDVENPDVWIHDLARGTRTRLTFKRGPDGGLSWSQDGTRLAVNEFDADPPVIRFYATDGSGEMGTPIEGARGTLSADWSVAVFERSGETRDVWMQDLAGSGEPHAVVATPADERNPVVSPDGRLLAYRSDESGQMEIYLTRLPDGVGKWQVSIDGAQAAVWGKGGDRLYYSGRSGVLYEVEIATKPNLVLGSPREVVDAARLGVAWWFGWDVAADGERFLMVRSAQGSGNSESVSVVENWYEEFRGRE